jgi:hypothetical protein
MADELAVSSGSLASADRLPVPRRPGWHTVAGERSTGSADLDFAAVLERRAWWDRIRRRQLRGRMRATGHGGAWVSRAVDQQRPNQWPDGELIFARVQGSGIAGGNVARLDGSVEWHTQ